MLDMQRDLLITVKCYGREQYIADAKYFRDNGLNIIAMTEMVI